MGGQFDGALEDVFGLQDQITTSVVGLLAPTLEQAEIERAKQKPTDRLDSYDFYLRGMALANKSRLPEARELFRKAFEQDPEYAAAYAMAAWTLLRQQAIGGVPLTAEMGSDAIRLANLGSRLANDDAFALVRSRPGIPRARIRSWSVVSRAGRRSQPESRYRMVLSGVGLADVRGGGTRYRKLRPNDQVKSS